MVRTSWVDSVTAQNTYHEERAVFLVPIARTIDIGKVDMVGNMENVAVGIMEVEAVGIVGIKAVGVVGISTTGVGWIDAVDIVKIDVGVGGVGDRSWHIGGAACRGSSAMRTVWTPAIRRGTMKGNR